MIYNLRKIFKFSILLKKIVPLSFIPSSFFLHDDVPEDKDINHDNWQKYLLKNFDHEGFDVLEIGSRVVTGSHFGQKFKHAHYVGFDYYDGENVDVIGDAHELSSYFRGGEQKFDLIFSSAVFEHFAMPWKVSTEIIKLLKIGGYVFIETHYSYGSHERPWHFFQYSENALNVLFPEKFGIECVKKGCSNLIKGCFSSYASSYLRRIPVSGLYCHSEFLGKKIKNVENLSWSYIRTEDATNSTQYPIK